VGLVVEGAGAGFGADFLCWTTLTLTVRDLLPPSPVAFSVHVLDPDDGAFAVFVPEAPETVPTPWSMPSYLLAPDTPLHDSFTSWLCEGLEGDTVKLPITGAGFLGVVIGAFGVVADFFGWTTLTLAVRDLLPPSPTAFRVHVRVPVEGAFAVFEPEAPETVPTPWSMPSDLLAPDTPLHDNVTC
jgi:hypothetical protein